MFLNFPDPKIAAERVVKPHADDGETIYPSLVLAEMRSFQRDTVVALADYLISEARKFELTNKTITFEELKTAGRKLAEYAKTIVPGDLADLHGGGYR